MEFRHYLEMFPALRGVTDNNRYVKIAEEIDSTIYMVKELVMLNNFFTGNGEYILYCVLEGKLSFNQAKKLKKIAEKHPEKFKSKVLYKSLCNGSIDFDRLDGCIDYYEHNEKQTNQLIWSYLYKEIDNVEFNTRLQEIGKLKVACEPINNDNSENKTSSINDDVINHNYIAKEEPLNDNDYLDIAKNGMVMEEKIASTEQSSSKTITISYINWTRCKGKIEVPIDYEFTTTNPTEIWKDLKENYPELLSKCKLLGPGTNILESLHISNNSNKGSNKVDADELQIPNHQKLSDNTHLK
jgi:hypothetical protein